MKSHKTLQLSVLLSAMSMAKGSLAVETQLPWGTEKCIRSEIQKQPAGKNPAAARDESAEFGIGERVPPTDGVKRPMVRQITGSSCGLASVSNALLDWDPRINMDQALWLNRILKNTSWYDGLRNRGNGLPLEQLKDLSEFMLKKLEIKNYSISHFRLPATGEEGKVPPPAVLKKVKDLLSVSGQSGDRVIVAEIKPSEVFIDQPEEVVGHYVEIRGYDPRTDLVQIVDPYPYYPARYWVKLDRFLKAVNTNDDDIPNARKGFLILDLPKERP